MDIELLKEKFWDWYFQHRDDDLDISDFLKSAFLAGAEAAQHRVQADGALPEFCRECMDEFGHPDNCIGCPNRPAANANR